MSNILVVDDDPSIRMLIGSVLRDEGHDVRTASDGKAALQRVAESMPDLILLDLAMPEMDGWHVLETLHRSGDRPRTRVVIVTANADAESFSWRSASPVHVIRKPFDIDALVDLVSDVLAEPAEALFQRRERTGSLVRLLERVDRALG